MNLATAFSIIVFEGSSVEISHSTIFRESVVSSGTFFPSVCFPVLSEEASPPPSSEVSEAEEDPASDDEEPPVSPLEHPVNAVPNMAAARINAKILFFIH